MRIKMLMQFISLFYLLTFVEGKEIMPNEKEKTGLEFFAHLIHTSRQTFAKLLLEEQLTANNDMSELPSEAYHPQNNTAKTLMINSCDKLIALYVRMMENSLNLQDGSIDQVNEIINLISSTDNQTATALALHLSNFRLSFEIGSTIDEQRKLAGEHYLLPSIVRKRHNEVFHQAMKLIDDASFLLDEALKSNKHVKEYLRLETIILHESAKCDIMCAEMKNLIAIKKIMKYFA